jgi:hypothetical protein
MLYPTELQAHQVVTARSASILALCASLCANRSGSRTGFDPRQELLLVDCNAISGEEDSERDEIATRLTHATSQVINLAEGMASSISRGIIRASLAGSVAPPSPLPSPPPTPAAPSSHT